MMLSLCLRYVSHASFAAECGWSKSLTTSSDATTSVTVSVIWCCQTSQLIKKTARLTSSLMEKVFLHPQLKHNCSETTETTDVIHRSFHPPPLNSAFGLHIRTGNGGRWDSTGRSSSCCWCHMKRRSSELQMVTWSVAIPPETVETVAFSRLLSCCITSYIRRRRVKSLHRLSDLWVYTGFLWLWPWPLPFSLMVTATQSH